MKKLLAVIMLCIAALFCLGGTKDYQLSYEYHLMSERDSLWGVTIKYYGRQDKYDDPRYLLDDIIEANHLQTTAAIVLLEPGNIIKVPLWREKNEQ